MPLAFWTGPSARAREISAPAAREAAVVERNWRRFIRVGRRSGPGHVGDSVRTALRPGKHRIGLVIVDKSLRLRVPVERARELHRDPAYDAGGVAAVRDPGGGHRRLPGSDAHKPVLVVLF